MIAALFTVVLKYMLNLSHSLVFPPLAKIFVSICVEGFSQNNVEEEEDEEDAT